MISNNITLSFFKKNLKSFISEKNIHSLKNEWKEILSGLKDLGKIKVTTYNQDALHIKTGHYDNVSFTGPVGQALTREIDLRLFLMGWKYGLAELADLTSLHFFDKEGNNVHSITFLENKTEVERFISLYLSDEPVKIELENPQVINSKSDSEINIIGLREAWRNLKDTHEFFEMLRKFQVTRTQALRLASPEYVTKIGNKDIYRLLEKAVLSKVSIMVFIGNKGCIQIHTDPINNLMKQKSAIIINDENFYMELNEDSFSEAYIVKKPTSDGVVTAVEVFDKQGEMIVQFFGERKPNTPELESWRQLIATI